MKNYEKLKFVVANAVLADKEYYQLFRFVVDLLNSVGNVEIDKIKPAIVEGLDIYHSRLEMQLDIENHQYRISKFLAMRLIEEDVGK